MATRLQESFEAVYQLLERPRAARWALSVLLVIHTFLLGYSAYVHSPTLNEPAHLVAGLSHWKFGRFDLYRVNPPLVRMVAALPVLVAGYQEDWSGFDDGVGERPEVSMGERLVTANGERSFFLFMISRWACIPFSWLGAIVCYVWARDLYGRPAGVFAASVWCFEPNILAHAALITPDAHATAVGLAACYTFWRWLQNPSWVQAVLTGCVLGLAELAKTTLIVFYPLWPMMWLVYRWPKRRQTRWFREGSMLALRMVIGLLVINVGYGLEGGLTLLKDFNFVSDLLTGRRAIVDGTWPENSPGSPPIPNSNFASVNRFANSWLGYLPVPFPKNYVLGIDIQQRDFEHYGRKSYLCGIWQDRGWWYYYVYACGIKVPLGLWALGFFTVVAQIIGKFNRLRRITKKRRGYECALPLYNSAELQVAEARSLHNSLCNEFVLLLPALVIFSVVSSNTGFSEHMRYVLPSFPYMFIAISQIINRTFLTGHTSLVDCKNFKNPRTCRRPAVFWGTVVCVLSIWGVTSSFWVYPHSLTYFNEFIGGPSNGIHHLLGSSFDWGQDLRYLIWWAESHPEGRPLFLFIPDSIDPRHVGLAYSLPEQFLLNYYTRNVRSIRLQHGVFAVRVNARLHGTCDVRVYDGSGVAMALVDSSLFPILLERSSVCKVGYTIDLHLIH